MKTLASILHWVAVCAASITAAMMVILATWHMARPTIIFQPEFTFSLTRVPEPNWVGVVILLVMALSIFYVIFQLCKERFDRLDREALTNWQAA